jgi:ribonuclease/clavin/mitogillin
MMSKSLINNDSLRWNSEKQAKTTKYVSGGSFMEGVHMLPVSTPTLLPAVTSNVFIVENNGQALIIDTGYDDANGAEQILEELKLLKIDYVVGIVLTHYHRDHSFGTKNLVDALHCPVFCHRLEKEDVEKAIEPISVSRALDEGDTIQIGNKTLHILHTPGHTKGHVSLWAEQERLLFSGDNIVGEGTTWIGPPDGSLIDYLQTLHRFQSLKARRIAPGHGPWVDNPEEKIQFVIQRRLEREKQIIEHLSKGASTVEELLNQIYKGKIHPSNHRAAEKTITGHLEKLIYENKVIKSGTEAAVFSLKR